MPDNHGAVDLSSVRRQALDDLTPEEQAAVDALADSTEPEAIKVRTAFIVYVDEDGNAEVTPDLDAPFVRQYLPSSDDVLGAVSCVVADFQAQRSAAQTVALTQQVAMQMQQQMRQQQQAAAIQQQIQQQGGLKR